METTFDKLHKLVSPTLMAYRDDLEKHDRNELQRHDHPFIYGWRPTGTNILFLRPTLEDWFPGMMYKPIFNPTYKLKDVEEAKKILQGELIWITHQAANYAFLYFDGTKLRKSTVEEVSAIWTKYVNNLK